MLAAQLTLETVTGSRDVRRPRPRLERGAGSGPEPRPSGHDDRISDPRRSIRDEGLDAPLDTLGRGDYWSLDRSESGGEV